jgi:hypothetical protein
LAAGTVVLELCEPLVLLVLDTPAAAPPLLLPTEELLVFLGPGLVALGVFLAGLMEVVVGTPRPPHPLRSVALASSPQARNFGLLMGMTDLFPDFPTPTRA